MRGADDLRTAIEEAAGAAMAFSSVRARGPLSRRIADAILADVLADPMRRLAILDAMGLDVSEPAGLRVLLDSLHLDVHEGLGRENVGGATIWCPPPGDNLDPLGDEFPVLVVRPKGGAS